MRFTTASCESGAWKCRRSELAPIPDGMASATSVVMLDTAPLPRWAGTQADAFNCHSARCRCPSRMPEHARELCVYLITNLPPCCLQIDVLPRPHRWLHRSRRRGAIPHICSAHNCVLGSPARPPYPAVDLSHRVVRTSGRPHPRPADGEEPHPRRRGHHDAHGRHPGGRGGPWELPRRPRRPPHNEVDLTPLHPSLSAPPAALRRCRRYSLSHNAAAEHPVGHLLPPQRGAGVRRDPRRDEPTGAGGPLCRTGYVHQCPLQGAALFQGHVQSTSTTLVNVQTGRFVYAPGRLAPQVAVKVATGDPAQQSPEFFRDYDVCVFFGRSFREQARWLLQL